MKIGIIGSGVVGQQLGFGFAKLGHEVKIGTRDESKLSEWKDQAGDKASSGSVKDAAGFGELIVLATKWEGTEAAIKSAGAEKFSGKIVIDVTNPLDLSQGGVPRLDAAEGNSGAEKIQKLIPDAKIVKAFNTISAYIMISPKREEGDPDLFIAGDDDESKKTVTKIAEAFGWKSVIDMGGLSQSFWLETFAMLWIHYGFKFNNWTHAFKLLKK
jgi:hypothetical protein